MGDLTTATQMAIDNADSRTLKVIATNQRHSQDLEVAQSTLASAVTMARTTRWFSLDGGSRDLGEIAAAYADLGYAEEAVKTAELIPIRQDRYLNRVTLALIRGGNKPEFTRLLILLSSHVNTAFMACGVLAQLYPQQADKIARVVERHGLERH
jgi:arginine utilization protein RocB